jgi:hypothetical protein
LNSQQEYHPELADWIAQSLGSRSSLCAIPRATIAFEEAHAKAHVDIQGTLSCPGIRMEIFSLGPSASEGSGGGNQEARQSGRYHGADRAILFVESIWPALESADSSSGALAAAVGGALTDLLPVVINAPATARRRTNGYPDMASD